MFQDLDYDDDGSPAIGTVPAGVSWEEIYDHIKIGHSPLLVRSAETSEYTGVYWRDSKMVVVEDLGPDHEEAIDDFREYLRQRGEN